MRVLRVVQLLPGQPVSRDRHPENTDAMVPAMAPVDARGVAVGPSHVLSGAALLAVELSEVARGIRGLDILRRSVDRAPPA
ncbi:hypothetical protein GCM10009843_22190 [Nocardioides bigeumensis]|uniref:Uncharacterized protein n=2 Tax=Nocardioides bigeumensis TaxID=433657 RepID=A0ABP5K257_9ACTN